MLLKKYLLAIFLLSTLFCSAQNITETEKKKFIIGKNIKFLESFLTEKIWNDFFPHRYGIGIKDTISNIPDFYSYKAFQSAVRAFPAFLSEGDESVKKRELAAFLANISHETSGGWSEAPGGSLKWGLYFLEENHNGNKINYTDTSQKTHKPVKGKYYYGRGPGQLSWNYNYGQFSEMWFGTKDSLLNNPDLISKDPVLAFASAIWFWMTAQKPKPSCHDIMTGLWIPSDVDKKNGRLSGFGATVNVINGGIECGKGKEPDKTNYRYKYYQFFCNYFKVKAGENIKCIHQKPFGK